MAIKNQHIENVMNREAVDSPLNRDIIFAGKKTRPSNVLGKTYFDPSSTFGVKWNRELTIKDISTETFNIYHMDEEIHTIIYIIKRLFIEQSSIWRRIEVYI